MWTPGAKTKGSERAVREAGRELEGRVSGRKMTNFKCTERSNIIIPCLSSIQDKLSPLDPFSGL